MPKPAFGQTLKRTRQELEKLRRQRADLDARIATLEHVEAALRTVAEPLKASAADLTSITDVVRKVLQSAGTPLSPTEVRDKMLAMGFDKGPYSQFLASVHVILKRLWTNGEAYEFTFADKKTYWWATKQMSHAPLPENVMLGKYHSSRRPDDLKSSRTRDNTPKIEQR